VTTLSRPLAQGGNAIRWRHGERLEHLFEERCDDAIRIGRADHPAVDSGGMTLTFGQLDERANQLARHLLRRGARPGDRIGLLFDDAVHAYVGMLAVLKIHAAYVPLDVGYPTDRLSFIVRDAGVRQVLSLGHLRDRLESVDVELVHVDESTALIESEDICRLTDTERGDPVDELCYIIYTSGSTGRPKGVAIRHASICNFVRVAAEVYGIEPQDRVYQGMTIAFDFSVEEIWVPLIAGATLVPKPPGSTLLGHELREYLTANDITAMCCVPTLLATLDEDVPRLRFLLVSGEACPRDLVSRWHRSDRRFLNVYGPTEATVTATWTSLHPDKPVTIGVPLPTYSVVILHPDEPEELQPGAVGEIGIAGIGLATGYVNRTDLTERSFIPDFLGIEGNTSGRIYRTGDLGRFNDEGEIEYHGRIDTQVKIRGFRIELTEIESVLLQVPCIAQAVVDTYESAPGQVELVGYYSLRADASGVSTQDVYDHLRGRLPAYMVPSYLEELAVVPMLPSGKADRKNLPAPSGKRALAAQHDHVAPAAGVESVLADAMGGVMGVGQVSAEAHFFDDLGANSLLLAQFSAKVRKHADLPPVSMKDIYQHPTIRDLAAALRKAGPAPAVSPGSEPVVAAGGQRQYVFCGALQLLVFLAYAYVVAFVGERASLWIASGRTPIEFYRRTVEAGAVGLLVLCTVPIIAKWVLIGRWTPREIPVWSLSYVRFWIVKMLVMFNPMALFAGSPIYVLYLRALGAKVGRGVAIFSRNVPVCTDLLTVGEGTVIRKDSFLPCYRARDGVIQTGPVTIGKNVFIGEMTVLEVETSMGDGAQLGHTSSLHRSQAVPAGEHWHGSPAQRTGVDYLRVPPAECGTSRRFSFGVLQLLGVLGIYLPLGIGIAALFSTVLVPRSESFTSWLFFRDELANSAVLFFAPLIVSLVLVLTVPRALNLALRPDRVYRLYGLRYSAQRTIARMTNNRFLMMVFGDSSYIVHYLRGLGYDLGRVEQTGSNFGVLQKHESPFLVSVGSGTMVSDGLSMVNTDFSSTSFRVSRASIGPRCFVGNNIVYPSGGRIGENCLLGTKAMIPLDGEVREGVGLLGSPCFEIPRSVERDHGFDHLKSGDEFHRRLKAKNRHNTVTIGLFLLARWFFFFVVTLLAQIASDLYDRFGAVAFAVNIVFTVVFGIVYFSVLERAGAGFRKLRPQYCSIYDPYFRWHERFWKMNVGRYISVFNGTPFKSAVWRLLGVRVGRRVFDDGCGIVEKTLVTIGDCCTLNLGSIIQCHSLEDGTFKSDRSTIGAGCTLGTGAFVHYGVTMGDASVAEADSFVMKGSELEPHAVWRGNPAMEVEAASPVRSTEGRSRLRIS
jgi:non-ribosomal peptide synthetase-like protein